MDYNSYLAIEKNYSRDISNDFLMPAELRKMFDAGAIDVIADENALLLLEKREGFAKLHFRVTRADNMVIRPNELTAAFLTYRVGKTPEAAAEWLIGQGFDKAKLLRRYTALEITGDITEEGVDRATADEAYSMLREHFNAVEVDMPCRELFEGALCVRSSGGVLIGILYMGRTLCLAVSEEARGQGVGRRLYRAYAAVKAREAKKPRFHEWVAPENAASIAMFQGLGFKADDIYSACYVSGKQAE